MTHDYKNDPYEDDYLRERLVNMLAAQKAAHERGGLLLDSGAFWMPGVYDFDGIERAHEFYGYSAPFGKITTDDDLTRIARHSVYFIELKPDAKIPERLKPLQQIWYPAIGYVDEGKRTICVRVPEAETEITFTHISLAERPWQMMEKVNKMLKDANAGAWVWRLMADPQAEQRKPEDNIRHLYPDGYVPQIGNNNTRAAVTGFAIGTTGYQRDMIYVGMAAHKTSCESIWASLISGGRSMPSMDSVYLSPRGAVKMLTVPMPQYACIHATVIAVSALPGQWTGDDDFVHALVFADMPGDTEAALAHAAYVRIQEALPYALRDEWESAIWEHALEQEFITRLVTRGDCKAGVEVNLTKDWLGLINGLLENGTLVVEEGIPVELPARVAAEA